MAIAEDWVLVPREPTQDMARRFIGVYTNSCFNLAWLAALAAAPAAPPQPSARGSKSKMKIILFNGPPRSGKDTAAVAVNVMFHGPYRPEGYTHSPYFDRLSMPIKRAFAGMMKLDIDKWGGVWPHEGQKEDMIPELGCSYRQWQIDFSERFMKPHYGQNIFARLFLQRYEHKQRNPIILLVPDCGFQIELDTILAAFDPSDVLLVRIYRKDCDFRGDSREYVEPNGRCCFAPVANITTKEEFEARILNAVRSFLERAMPAARSVDTPEATT